MVRPKTPAVAGGGRLLRDRWRLCPPGTAGVSRQSSGRQQPCRKAVPGGRLTRQQRLDLPPHFRRKAGARAAAPVGQQAFQDLVRRHQRELRHLPVLVDRHQALGQDAAVPVDALDHIAQAAIAGGAPDRDLPAVLQAGNPVLLRRWFIVSIAVLLAAHLALPWLQGSIWFLSLFLLAFFAPFNALEAMLPTLTTRLAPAHAKGTAIGLYSTIQFFGTFLGASAGGVLYKNWGANAVIGFDIVLLAIWLILALGMRVPPVKNA